MSDRGQHAQRDRWPAGPQFRRARQRKVGNTTLSVRYGQIWIDDSVGCVRLSFDAFQALKALARDAAPRGRSK